MTSSTGRGEVGSLLGVVTYTLRMVIPLAVAQAVVEHARACLPEECCGLLGGREGQVLTYEPCVNTLTGTEPARTSFMVDPDSYRDAIDRFEERGLEVVGVAHSHPIEPAYPSDYDKQRAASPHLAGWVHVIVSMGGDHPELRAYRFPEGVTTEVTARA